MEKEVQETLRGVVQKIIFSAKDTGFAIIILKIGENGNSKDVTLSGSLPHVVAGEEITAEGLWKEHEKYGRQFSVSSYMKIMPTKADAIEAYLGSGMIKGLGPSTAAKIVKAFGDAALDVLTKEPQRLMEIPGIGKKKYESIALGWKEQTAVTDIMVFLSGCGITPAYAAKIYRRYGLDAIRVVRENPYQLSYDVDGIGFLVADRIAGKLGYLPDNLHRIKAGTLYALEEGRRNGHVYYPDNVLKEAAVKFLEVDVKLVERAIACLAADKRIVVDVVDGQCNIYCHSLYVQETETAEMLKRLVNARSFFKNRMGDVDEQIAKAEAKFKVRLSLEQKSAVVKACKNTVSVLTGGPGTGKTLSTRVIVEVFKQKKAEILLAAPTGKAAKRLENCGQEAKTIHRLLEFSPKGGGFVRGKEYPLDCGVLIVDEASMIDIPLFYYLLLAVPAGAHLIIIGDADQLPPVGPGLAMRNLAESGVLPLTVLNQIYRQAEGSGIIQIAHSINKGIVPDPAHYGKDCYFLPFDDAGAAVARTIEAVGKLRAANIEVQVISPMRKGEAGTEKLNELLQDAMNPIPAGQEESYQVVSGFRKFRVNDRVIQLKNDYDKDVFNGDSGIVESIDHEEQLLVVAFEGRGAVEYDFLDLDELALSYAITVHKSQGSEYDTVIVMCLNQHYAMLARNLLYTAVSRAKKMVIIIGAPKAIKIAVHNNKQRARYTRLRERVVGIHTV